METAEPATGGVLDLNLADIIFVEVQLADIAVCCDIRMIATFVYCLRCFPFLLQPLGEGLAAWQPSVRWIHRRPSTARSLASNSSDQQNDAQAAARRCRWPTPSGWIDVG